LAQIIPPMMKKEEGDNRPIPYRDTLDLVSAFVIQTTEFLNRFASTCEERLNNVEYNIQQLEITLQILESKLSSIDNMQMPQVAQEVKQEVVQNGPPPPVPQQYVEAISMEPPPPTSNVLLVKDDKRLEKYFKLLRMRVPVEQIKLNMTREGFDASLIERPEDPSPLGAYEEEDLKTDGSFSSDEE
jgi:WASH complex subunit CCDC53